jgi:phage gpG-like protein
MAVELSFTLEGEKQLSRKLLITSKKVQNWSAEMRKTGQLLKKTFSGPVFTSEGAEIGEPWISGPDYHGLVRTGNMRGSFNFKSTKNAVNVGNTTSYFIYHQSIADRSKLPRRIMMKIDEKRRQLIVKIFQKSIRKVLNINV